MKVLILSLSEHSLGELHNALFFAGQLKKTGGEVFIIATVNHLDYARAAGFEVAAWGKKRRTNEEFLRQRILEMRPDAVVLADYYNMYLEEPFFNIGMVLDLGVPVATFDSMNFAPGPTSLEKEILRESRFAGAFGKGGQFKIELPALPPEMAVLRTCPINRPVQEPGILPVALYKEPLTLTAERREEVRSRYGLVPGEKLVMLAKAGWAHLAVKIRAMERSLTLRFSYEKQLQRLLQLYLRDVSRPVTVIGVGPQVIFDRNHQNVRFVSLPFLSLVDYQELLLASDLFISDNITSASAAKAVIGGVPALILINSLVSNRDGTYQASFNLEEEVVALLNQWEQAVPGSIFPFYVYPFGWIRELASLLEGNPFFDVIVKAEMFDVSSTGESVARLLFDEAYRKDLAGSQADYYELMASLPGALEAVQWVRQRWLDGTGSR
ncbi:MAG: DUF6365 family protein [Bacillota bacterium]